MHTAILTTALIFPAHDASGPAACRRSEGVLDFGLSALN
jgi:hypothetical protein